MTSLNATNQTENVTAAAAAAAAVSDTTAKDATAISIAAFGICSNLLIFGLICSDRGLRQNYKYLQAALACADSYLCSGQLINAVAGILVPSPNLSIRHWSCLLLSTPSVSGSINSGCLTLFIALDRLYAVLFPHSYRSLRTDRICCLCVLAAGCVAFGCASAVFTDVDLYDIPRGCVGSSARSAKYNSLLNYANVVIGSIMLIVYAALLAVIWFKLRISRDLSTSFKKQLDASYAVLCLIAVSLTLYVVPNLIVVAVPAASGMRTYVSIGLSAHASMNFFVYLWKDRALRQAFLKTFTHAASQAFVKSRIDSRVKSVTENHPQSTR